MPQITKDPLGNDVELLSLTEWSDKNQKDLNEDTLNQYAGYATGQFLRAGQKPEDFQNKLYSGLFQKGQQAGVFQPQDEAQTTQLFESFANKPLTDDAADLDLVSKSLLNTDPEQAARVADVYQRVKSGQPDPNLELDLEDVRKNIATPDRVQAARIGYAKERGLGFIDYPTDEPGRRDVWINNQANPDRKAIYDTLGLAQGIVDPRSAALAEEWIKTDEGRTTNRWGQRTNSEIQSLLQERLTQADPESAFQQNMASAVEYASESAKEYGIGADVTAKAPTDEVAGTKQVIATPTGAVYAEGTAQRVASNRVADTAIRSAYRNLKETDPNNALVSEYSEDQFLNAARDFVRQRITTPTNQDDPTKNFVTLTDGTRAPLASAALLPKEKFAQAMDTLGLDEKEKAAAASLRTSWISANLTPIRDALFDFEGDKFLEFTQKNVDKYSGTVELTEAYLNQMEPSTWQTFGAKAQGVLRSVPNSLSAIFQAVGGGASNAINWEGGQKAFADWAEADAMQEQRRGTFVNLYGGEMGLGYTLFSQAAPLLADIAISKGAGTLAKVAAKPVVGSAIRTTEGLMGQTAKTFIGNALKPETKSLVGNYLKKFTVAGAEKSPAQVLRAVRRDLEEKFVAGTATATQIGTSFTRSAQQAWTNTSMEMRQAKNPDGTPKYTEEEINDTATTNALYSGAITALVERGFGKVFGEGADVTAIGTANIRQLKSYSNRLTGALERGGFGGSELFDTLKQVSREVVNEGWGDAIKQIPAEAAEEFTDEFTQNVVQNLLDDEQINFKQAFTQGLQAAVVGGVYGGALGTTNKIGLRQADIARDTFAGTAQAIERDLMDRTVAKLQESGGNPQTIAALQDRMRVAQRRGQAISQNIPVRAAKQDLINELDATSEEPFEVPMAPAEPPSTKTPASVTKFASQLAKELAVNEEELNSIQPSGTDKQGNPQVTPNDVRAFVNRRTEQMGLDLNSFLPGPDVTAPEGGFQLVGEERTDSPENRTFDDLKNRVVVIDGLRGRLRIEDEGVILDPEDGSTPFEVTPNKDLPVKDFEGFNTLLQEGAAVSPRRQAREVSEVTDGGQIVYGDTTYDLPEKPLIANIKRDDTGAVESMHMRVYNSKGLATWVYVAGDNVPKVETAYRVRGPEAITGLTAAVDNAARQEVNRNAAAQTFKAKQSKQRRQDKRAKNNAPLVTDRGQRAAEAAPDYRATRINQPGAPQQLVEEIRAVATQLGIDPEVYTDDAELFALVAPELAAGLDLQAFTPQQKSQAVQNLARNDNNPETLLEYLISDELLPPQERVKRDSNIAALRARNSNQLKKHSIKPGASVKTILENVARTASSKAHRESAKELLRLGADNVPTSFVYLPNNIGIAGAYLPASNAVVVNLASDNGGGALDAMLHELGHAVTDRVITAPANEFEQQLRSRLMSLRAEYAERANAKYGNNMPPDLRYTLEGRAKLSEPFSEVDGTREMAAHFYGSSKFRKQLNELSPKGERNFVQKFIDIIASLFSGQPVASKQYQELAKVITDLSNANQTLGQNPYGRTVAQVAASRAGVNHENRVGPLFGVPNPHSRDDLEWILHQVQTLRYSDLSNEEINDIILTQRFGMFTGENPNDTQFPERENKEFNKKAVQWLQERGYQVIPIVGKYNRGENSFLVPGLTDQDAVDAANDLVQDSVVTNTGMYFKGGLYHPRVGEAIDQPIGANDNFFSTLLDTNGNVTTIRVWYDFDTTLDSGIKYSKGDQQAAPVTKIAKSLAAQGEFEVVEDREINKPLQFENGRLLVNPALADARYEDYSVEDAGDLQELDARLAVAIGLANDTNGPSIQLSFEEVGLSPDSVIEQAAYNTLTNADLQDLLKVKDQAKQFVASAYYHIALRNSGDNERLATAQNRVADLYRYLLRDGAGLPDGPEKFNPLDVGPVTLQLANRSKTPAPIVRYSRAAVEIDPVEVRSRTKAGKAVGTRNPTSAKATEDGADPSNLVDLASLKRNTQAYRKNALLLLEYPIVAREFPELAKEYAKIRGAVLKAQDKAKANGIKIKGAKDTAKKTLASYLGVTKAKVSGKMLEDAIENPESAFVTKEQPGTVAGNKEARARSKALAAFNKSLDQIKKYEAEGAVLGTDSSKALKTYTDTLDKIAKDPKHPIAKQADEIYDTLIEVTKSNLRMLMDVFPSDIRDIANLWYDGANIIAQQFAGDNYSIEQSAGVLAVFSPQKDWFQNVELAKRTMEIWTADQEYGWDDAMSARWLMRGGEPELKENKDGTVSYAKGIKPDLDENGEHRTDENGMLLFHGWGSEKVKAKRQQAFERLQSLKGKKLKDLSPEQQAWFIRMRAETKYEPSYPIVSPDGRFGNPSTSTNNKGVTKEIKLAWGTYGSIGKAINILTAPAETQMKVISDELGDQHKVRSFYNNIVDPQNNDGHVTMDTHAIAALFWQAFSGNSREVGQNFGTANTATDSLTGVGGLYPAFAEAYRAVAAEYGMLPRQVQSITWEAVRMLFTARWKSKSENVNGVRAKWVQYQNNEISLDQAQTAVFAMATNGKDLATAVANSNDEQLGLGFPSWADVTEGPAPAGIALSRAARVSEPVRLSKEQRTGSVELISSLTGADQKTRRGVFDGLVNLSNDDLLSVTERLNKKTLRWLIGSAAEDQSKVALLSTLRRAVRKQIENAPQYQQGAALFREDDVRRVPVDRLAARVALSRAATQLDTDYLAAVNAGDVAAQQRLVDAAARAAGGVEVYHGGDLEGSTIDFKKAKRGAVSERRDGAFYGSTNKKVAESYRGATNRMFFFLQNPFEISTPTNRPASWTGKTAEITNGKRVERKTSLSIGEAIDRAKQNNKDGVVYSNIVDTGPAGAGAIGDTVVIFNSNQAKSADPIVRDNNGNVIPLSQRFDLTKPDIRYSRAATQLDADYMKAVESKDVGEQQRMVDEAAKAAGYDSPKVYHGTPAKSFNVFDINRQGSHRKDKTDIGFFFTSREGLAEKYTKGTGRIVSAHLSLKNPYRISVPEGYTWGESNTPTKQSQVFYDFQNKEIQKAAKDGGHDGIIVEGSDTLYIVFDPSQIKSADPITYDNNGNVIPLSQRFDLAKPDIRYSRAATGQPIKITAFHGGTYKQGVGQLRASKEGALGAGYYVTPNVDAAKTYAREGAYGDGIVGGSVSVFDVELKNPLVLEQFEAYPANILKLLGVSEDKAEAKGEKIMEDKGGYAGKEYQSLGVKLGYDGLVAVNANGDITEIVAWNQEALTDSFGGPSIALSRAAAQLDADYMKAVESKDVGEQQRLVGEAASKAGYNIRGYHGTRAQEGFTEFMPNEALGGAIFVATDSAEANAFGRVMDVFIKADNVRKGIVRSYDEVRAIAAAKKRGQDAIRVTDGLNAPVNYAVFDPSQIKSADPIVRDDNGNVIPLSQRFDLAKPDIRYSRAGLDTAPKAFRGRMVQLTHWSKATELKQTDPTEHGNGGAGKELERRREYGDIYVPRTYFGYGKYHRETFIGGNRYSMVVDGDSLYDLDRDPLDLYPDQEALQKAGYARFDNRAALTLFEKAIKDAGYKGYVSTSYQAGILFNKQKVTKVKDGNTSLPLAAPPSIAKSLAALTPVTPAENKAVAGAISSKRSQELAVAAVRMIEGRISIDDYADLVEFFDPWEVKGAGEIPSRDKIRQYMPGLTTGTERAKERLDRTFAVAPNGKLVEVRIDIPTFNASLSAGDPVYAITLHEPEKDDSKKIGDPIVYTNIARVLNPTMVVRGIGKKEARDIAAGASKIPLATVKGRNATITELPADINDPEVWTEVGFNPIRSSDFVDVRSKMAVVGGSEAIMVGPRVFVRDAEFAERATGYMTDKNPRYSKALHAITSPDPESAFTVSLDDLYVNKATGEWDAGGPVSRLFRASGNMDPRLFEAAKYQERGLRLAKVRLKDLMQSFQAALKSEPNADLDDVNLALGSTEPTVTTAQRDAAESVRSARINKANEAFDKAPANKAYLDAVNTARVNYATHRSKQKYTAEIQQAREDRKNSPEIQLRNAAIAAADAQYSKDIQAARMSNLAPVRKAQQQAQLRLEQSSPETAAAIANFRVAIDNLSSQLIDELDPGDPLRAIVDQNLGVYLTRTYKIHQDEGYAQRVLEDSEFANQRTRARAFFEKQWIDNTYDQWRKDVAYEPYSDSEVMALVRAEAKSKDVGTRELYKFVDKHSSTPKTFGRATNRTDLTRFMQKGEVPPELRTLLGEVQNPIENALRTYGNLAQFLGTQRLLTQYTKIGLDNDWLVTAADVENDPVKYRGYAPLVNTTDTNGGDPLAQYYAQPEVVTAFQTMFAPAPAAERNDAKKIWDAVQNAGGKVIGASMGALTLFSSSFFVRNLVSIPIFSSANGFVPTPKNIATAFKGITQVYGKNLEGLGADMIMLGISEGSMVSQTMRDFVRGVIDDPELMSNQIEAMLREVGTPGNFLVKAWNGAKITVDALATLNDQIDMLYKAAYWAHEVDVQIKANKHRSVPLTPQQIKQEAARVVRLTTQGRERVAPIAKEFQRSGLGMLFNSFFRFTAEIYRLPLATIQLGMEEVKSGNPVLVTRGRQRLIGLGSTLAFLGYGAPALLKSMFDVDDDEEEAIRTAQPAWATDSNLFITSNPEEETTTTWDITYINGFSIITDGIARSIHHAVNGRWEKIPGVIASNLAKSFVSPQIAVEAFTQASSNRNDRGAALWLEDDPTTTKISKVLKHLANSAYRLRTPTQFWKAYQAYTNGGVSDEGARFEKASEILVGEIMPFRVYTSKNEQLAMTAFGKLKRQLDAAKQTLGEFKSYEQLDKERVNGVYDRYETSLVAINERIRKTAKGFEKLGMSYAQMERQAYEAGISKRRFKDAVLNGRVESFKPSKDAMEDYMRIGGPENGPERVQLINEARYARPQYIKLNQN